MYMYFINPNPLMVLAMNLPEYTKIQHRAWAIQY